jgi:hypothetical protein
MSERFKLLWRKDHDRRDDHGRPDARP